MEGLFIIIAGIVGLVFGVLIGKVLYSERIMGNLKIVFADEKDPYIFLELGMDANKLAERKSIHLRVIKQDVTHN